MTTEIQLREIILVDSRVQDVATLLKGMPSGAEVVYLNASEAGLQQIASVLGVRGDVGSVHVLAHGSAGQLWLGSTFLDSATLSGQGDALAAIGRGLAVGGDLLVYACNLAQGNAGAQFVHSLAELTGADVAASSNLTGAGGDWQLEIATGEVEAGLPFAQQAVGAYERSLATLTVTTNTDQTVGASLAADISDGGGLSIREAIAWAAASGDTITFQAGATNSVLSLGELLIAKNVTIDGDLDNNGSADVTIDGNYSSRVLHVLSGSNAKLDGLVITKGLVSGNGAGSGNAVAGGFAHAGGIYNAGSLTLNNVTVTANAATGGGGGGGVLGANVGGGGGGGSGASGIGGGNGGNAGAGGGTYSGVAGGGGSGGRGGGYDAVNMGGRGGTSAGGGAGGIGTSAYSNGGAGASAAAGGVTIGGGGGGSGWDGNGGNGGAAAGGIFNSGTLTIIGASAITNNIGAGGGGGGGGGSGNHAGVGGRGVGAIWNEAGTINITAANYSAMTGNVGNSGAIGDVTNSGSNSGFSSPAGVNNIYNDGGVLNTAYAPPPTATIVVADSALSIGETSTVTFTFSEAVTGFDNADLTIANGTLSAVSSSDGGITWTATLTPTAGITDATNVITLDNTGVTNAGSTAGTGTTDSNNYAIDTQRPTATLVVTDTALTVGETSLVTITFSEAVTGFTNADLTIANGTLSAVSSSNGGITWTATLTPSASITDATNLITLDNTGVTDAAGNAGTGSTDSNNYAIDTQRPTATLVVTDTALTAGETSLVTITFSEAVTGFTTADLAVANGSLSALSSSDGGVTWTATLTPTASADDPTNVITLNNTGVTDLAGNTGTGTTDSNNYAVNTVRPTATVVVADSALAVGETSGVTITFSEAVTGFDNTDLTVANGTLSAVSSSDGGITWTATLTPSAGITDASNLITLDNTGVTNAGGNTGTGTTDSNNYAIDTARPTATVVVADTALAIGETSGVTITFSEAVTGFSTADLTAANGTLSNLSTSDNITYTATFTPTAGITDTTNLITLDNTGVIDTAGNAGTGTTDSNNYAIDSQRPTATVVVSDAALTAGETSQVTITFSEAVTGFTNADLTVANGTLSAVSSADGGITWTATLTPTASVDDATNLITLNNTGVADAAGNAGTGTTDSNNYTVNTVRPTATVVVADSALAVGETSGVTITFSEAVTGFDNTDLTVANGTLSAVSSSDGGITWTATLTPTAGITDATNLITLDNTGVTNAGGNTGTGTTDSNNYAIDTARPTASVVVADTALAIGETSGVTITFSEAVTGFTNADLTVVNGTLSAVSSGDGGLTWTATFTPTVGITDTTNLITLDNTGVADVAGNAGTGTTDSNNYVVDTLAPALASATVNGNQLVLTYTEAATLDATNAPATTDFAVAVGATANTVTAVAVNAAAKTVTLTLTTAVVAGQAVTVAYTDPTAGNDANAIQDAAGNDAASFAATSATNLTPAIPDPEPEPTPPTPVPPTPPTPGVPDNDGIPPTVEDQTPGIPGPGGNTTPGDGNGDGIKDSEQPSVGSVGFVLSPTGESNPGNAPPTFTTLVASSQNGKVGSGNDNSRITSLTQKDAPADAPAGLQTPIGLVSFTVELAQGKSSESFSLYLDPALGVNGYWKQDASGTWVNLASEPYGGKMVMEGGRVRLDFQITDGGQFDADGKVDGIITDPGAPGHMPLSIVGMTPDMPHGFWF